MSNAKTEVRRGLLGGSHVQYIDRLAQKVAGALHLQVNVAGAGCRVGLRLMSALQTGTAVRAVSRARSCFERGLCA